MCFTAGATEKSKTGSLKEFLNNAKEFHDNAQKLNNGNNKPQQKTEPIAQIPIPKEKEISQNKGGLNFASMSEEEFKELTVEDKKEILVQKIEEILERGERIEDLVSKSEDLNGIQKNFYNNSVKLGNDNFLRNVIGGTVIIAAVGLWYFFSPKKSKNTV